MRYSIETAKAAFVIEADKFIVEDGSVGFFVDMEPIAVFREWLLVTRIEEGVRSAKHDV